MISPEAAWTALDQILGEIAPPARTVARSQAAGCRLAAAVVATTDLPSADVSALDGFAFAGAPGPDGMYRVAGLALAGGAPAGPLQPGEAARVMTGAPVPPGGDRVVGFEDVDESNGRVQARAGAAAKEARIGSAIRRQGEVVRAGDPLLESGTLLSPAALALLASQGIEEVDTVEPPVVEVLVTGDEVVRTAAIRPGEVRDSHTDFLVAELGRLGIVARRGPTVGDRREELESRLANALDTADVVLTCGGVSMGDADLVPGSLARLGCRALFHGVAIQPGKPLLAAVRGRTLVFGLPGNPGSVMAGYWLFVRPALQRLLGREAGFWSDALAATLAAPLGAGRGRDRFVPAKTTVDAGRIVATPVSPKGSHDLVAFALADSLLRVRAGEPARAAGDSVELIRL